VKAAWCRLGLRCNQSVGENAHRASRKKWNPDERFVPNCHRYGGEDSRHECHHEGDDRSSPFLLSVIFYFWGGYGNHVIPSGL
jgi:hypothetical protein